MLLETARPSEVIAGVTLKFYHPKWRVERGSLKTQHALLLCYSSNPKHFQTLTLIGKSVTKWAFPIGSTYSGLLNYADQLEVICMEGKMLNISNQQF